MAVMSTQHNDQVFPSREVILQFATYEEAANSSDAASWFAGTQIERDTLAGRQIGLF